MSNFPKAWDYNAKKKTMPVRPRFRWGRRLQSRTWNGAGYGKVKLEKDRLRWTTSKYNEEIVHTIPPRLQRKGANYLKHFYPSGSDKALRSGLNGSSKTKSKTACFIPRGYVLAQQQTGRLWVRIMQKNGIVENLGGDQSSPRTNEVRQVFTDAFEVAYVMGK